MEYKFKAGDIVIVKDKSPYTKIPKGAVALVKGVYPHHTQAYDIEILLPYAHTYGYKDNGRTHAIVEGGLELSTVKYDLADINAEAYNYEMTGGVMFNIQKVKAAVEESVVKTLFKYLPIVYDNIDAFIKDDISAVMWSDKSKKDGSLKPRLVKLKSAAYSRYFSLRPIITHCKAQVVSCADSIKLFGHGPTKRESLDKIFEIADIELAAEVKKSDKPEHTIYLIVNGTKYRYSLSDVKLIYPNITGFQLKKDRTIKSGCVVKCVNDRHSLKIKKGNKVVVDHIKSIGTKKYIGFVDNDDIVYMKMKNFKLA